MKTLTILLIALSAYTLANAQTGTKANLQNFKLSFNGNTFNSGDSVSRDDLRQLCNAELQDSAGKKIPLLSGAFVVTTKGMIWKGNCPGTGDQKKKFEDLLVRASTGDAIFLDHIEAADKLILPKQFAFILK